MSLLKRLGKLLAGEPRPDSSALWVHVRCCRCGEVIAARVDLRNEPSIQYDSSGQLSGYHVRKVLVGGTRRCYQPIEVELSLDPSLRVVDRQITGGEFISAEEYAAEAPSE